MLDFDEEGGAPLDIYRGEKRSPKFGEETRFM